MSKEKQIQERKSKQLLEELSKMPPMIIATAYLHAINYTLYGVDVTEKWETTTQNSSALEKAYREGYYDAMQRQGWEKKYYSMIAIPNTDIESEDCISRKDVLDIIDFEDKWLFDAKSHNADTKIAFSGLKSKVKDLPSVAPKAESEVTEESRMFMS